MSLYDLARDITYELCGNDLAVGRYFLFRETGDGLGVPIQIIGGQFMGIYGLSNHWSWQFVGTKKTGCGYGGREPHFTRITKEEALK